MADINFEEDFETYAGTRLFIAEGRPPTNVETGFEALAWNEITITSVGSYRGRTFSNATVSVVSTGRDREKKGPYTFGTAEFPVLWLPDQAGQVVAREYSEGVNQYDTASFAVVDQNDGVSYFTAQVSTFTEAGGGNADARTGTLSLLRQSDTIDAVTPIVPTEATP